MENQDLAMIKKLTKVNGNVYAKTRFGFLKGRVDEILEQDMVLVSLPSGVYDEFSYEDIIPIVKSKQYVLEEQYLEKQDKYQVGAVIGVFDNSKLKRPEHFKPTEKNIYENDKLQVKLAGLSIGRKLILKTGEEILKDYFKK
ncbi:hypothetical protein P4493_06085 [Bacillus thuringiensis]|uniref:Uncharacterized protein n=3 Tax=Bacillus thuringiensis TaxID=1428 RepID=A0A0B5NCD7_BACTU|nr:MULTISPECIES: hypothetical protein [Bacillus]EAO53434.1 hypothetical protein RBTH_04825 [Bacillus thuringiensis serovar israelensis ATCC 35646]MEC2533133.1 hypothetical protein [Bacillus cereus]MED1153887.1 hypothetical protein [Bacillus paranthracis]OUB09266.1 hypothetical protein BK708_32560 [Bacillus thuringiensis serovar yunnanensis]AFQ30195.1 hypothetical protein BTF1_30472 [Bacillus thuringiensis HD-789]